MTMKAKHLIYRLYEKNYRFLGAGVYSAVFASKKQENIVYKVGNTISDPYLTYVENGPINNIHFPKVYSIVKSKKYDMYIAKLEKLEDFSEYFDGPLSFKLLNDFNKSLLSGDFSYKEEYSNIGISKNITDVVKHIYKICDDFYEYKIDLHSANVMCNSNTLVITDPIANYSFSGFSDVVEDWLEESIENM